MKNSLVIIFLLMGQFIQSQAQENLSQSLGNLSSKDWDGKRLELLTNFGKVRIYFIDEGIVRVHAVKSDFKKDFSYAVVEQTANPAIEFNQNRGFLELKSRLITVRITERPVRISFYTSDGQLLNEDEPSFGTSWLGNEVTTYKTLQPNEKFIGLGAKTGGLNRFGSAFVHWNTDNPNYQTYSDPLYTSIPFYMGIVNRNVYGIFFDNTWQSRFNFGASNDRFSYFSADGGEMDYYFFHEKSVANIIDLYTQLTGRMNMPALWTLGYQQCRWSYTPDTDVLNVAKTFRTKQIPADVMYLDIDYMDAYKIFTWHPKNFSNPKQLLTNLKEMGFHTTVIVDPGIKVEKGYHAYEDGLKKNLFALYPDGTPFTAQVWPGWCHFPDFTNPEARLWWGNLFNGYVDLGVEGFWNDMNEIATWGQQVPSLVQFDWEGRKTSYLEAKNMYGMQMARSTFEGTRKLLNGKRPFVLTRAGFAGLQRYSALWTGDNQAHDEHMLLGVRLVNTLGLSGISQVGYDVAGFIGNATPELYSRWISLGAFSPFFRGHTAKNTVRSEPWSYGEEPEAIAKKYISFHYNLIPYIYSAFKQSTQTGLPVQRSLTIDYTFDENIYKPTFENQYMFGPAFLVAPVTSDQKAVNVYFPEGKWYNLYNDRMIEGNHEQFVEAPLQRLPVYVKGGSVIPMQSVVQNTNEKPDETLEMHVYKGKQSEPYVWYEDDGSTYEFETGSYYQRNIVIDATAKSLVLSKVEGSFNSSFTKIRFVMHGFGNELKGLMSDKKQISFDNSATFIDILNDDKKLDNLVIFTVENTENQININW
jgi:alpha-glucosidase